MLDNLSLLLPLRVFNRHLVNLLIPSGILNRANTVHTLYVHCTGFLNGCSVPYLPLPVPAHQISGLQDPSDGISYKGTSVYVSCVWHVHCTSSLDRCSVPYCPYVYTNA